MNVAWLFVIVCGLIVLACCALAVLDVSMRTTRPHKAGLRVRKKYEDMANSDGESRRTRTGRVRRRRRA